MSFLVFKAPINYNCFEDILFIFIVFPCSSLATYTLADLYLSSDPVLGIIGVLSCLVELVLGIEPKRPQALNN